MKACIIIPQLELSAIQWIYDYLAGGYFYNTEAHPIDPGILYCCSLKHQYDTKSLEDLEETLDIASMIGLDLQSNDNEHLNVHEERFYTLKNDVQMKDIDEDISETMLENTASNSHLVTEELKLHQDSLSNSSENIAFSSAMILNILQNVSNELLKQTDHFTQLSRSKLNERDDFNLFEAFCEVKDLIFYLPFICNQMHFKGMLRITR